MKKIVIIILALLLLLPAPSFGATAVKKSVKSTTPVVAKKVVKPVAKPKPPVVTAESLIGRFLIQKESYNRLWYVNPENKKRYLIQNDDDLRKIIESYAVNAGADLKKILAKNKDASFKKYHGKIIWDGTSPEYWYVNPADGRPYLINNFENVYKTMKIIGKTVADTDLRKVSMNDEQLTFDSAFPAAAYVKYDGVNFSAGYNNKTILPLASLTKVMTALILLDQNLDWDKRVVIAQEEINYPKKLVGDDGTSEISLKAGDIAKMSDLWIAMLSASSNQSAVILADNSGLTRDEFVKAMNQKAHDLGLKKTVFHEFTGLDFNNIGTPEEMAIIGREAFANLKISEATNVVNYTFAVENNGEVRKVNVKNRNYSLLAFNPEGSKTGYLVEAKCNVVLKKNDDIIVVLHASGTAQRNEIVKKLVSNILSYNR